jgi:hypothetical protein
LIERKEKKKKGTNPFYSIGSQPMETFDEDEADEEHDKAGIEFVPEHRQGEQGFTDGKPESIIDPLDFGQSELSKEDGLEDFGEDDSAKDTKVTEDLVSGKESSISI